VEEAREEAVKHEAEAKEEARQLEAEKTKRPRPRRMPSRRTSVI
jgi:hypothetical protein